MKTCIGNRNGFTLMECMMAMVIFSLFVSGGFWVFSSLRGINMYHQDIQDLNGIHQLALILATATDLQVGSDELTYYFDEQNFTISLVNNRLIIQPGTNIIMMNLDDVAFEEAESGQITMSYKRAKKTNRRVIYY